MKYNNEFDVYAPTTELNVERMKIRTWSKVTTIMGNIQPYGGKVAQYTYGILDETTHRLFCDNNDELIESRTILGHGVTYSIVYVKAMSTHSEVLLKKVIA